MTDKKIEENKIKNQIQNVRNQIKILDQNNFFDMINKHNINNTPQNNYNITENLDNITESLDNKTNSDNKTLSDKEWFNTLNKSILTPPLFSFKYISIIIYIFTIIFILLINKKNYILNFSNPLIIYFIINFILLFIWIIIFFKYKNIIFSLYILFIILFFSYLSFINIQSINKLCQYLFIPYIICLCFIFYLNQHIVIYN